MTFSEDEAAKALALIRLVEYGYKARLQELAHLALLVLDTERDRTGIDGWDESDPRCVLYNEAWIVVHSDDAP